MPDCKINDPSKYFDTFQRIALVDWLRKDGGYPNAGNIYADYGGVEFTESNERDAETVRITWDDARERADLYTDDAFVRHFRTAMSLKSHVEEVSVEQLWRYLSTLRPIEITRIVYCYDLMGSLFDWHINSKSLTAKDSTGLRVGFYFASTYRFYLPAFRHIV